MDVARKAIAFAVIGLIAGAFPLSTAHADPGDLLGDSPNGGEVLAETVQTVGDTIDKTVKETTGETDDPSGGVTAPVTDPVVDGLGDELGLNSGGTAPQTNDKDRKKKTGSNDRARNADRDADAVVLAAGYRASVDRMAKRAGRRELKGDGFDRAVSFRSSTEPSLGDRAAQTVLDAAKAFTFPAILIGLIVGFILVQNRIDHRDPKLAYAPVSSDQDFLSFS